MDYIERERRRLEIDLYALSRRWHGTLSRMFVLRDRLDGIDPTDAEAFSQTANTLGAFANDATSLANATSTKRNVGLPRSTWTRNGGPMRTWTAPAGI